MATTIGDLIAATATDTQTAATDKATVAADQAKLSTDQATQTTDQGQQSADTLTLAAALVVTGPTFTLSADGSVSVYSSADGKTLDVVTAQPAGSVPVPA